MKTKDDQPYLGPSSIAAELALESLIQDEKECSAADCEDCDLLDCPFRVENEF